MELKDFLPSRRKSLREQAFWGQVATYCSACALHQNGTCEKKRLLKKEVGAGCRPKCFIL